MVGILLFAVVAIPAYWTVWFIDPLILATSREPAYFVFENAFPLPDGWIVLAAVLAAVAIVRRRASALVWTPAAGATSIFLALIDLSFDAQNGILLAPTGDVLGVVIELLNIALTFSGGAFALHWTWKNRLALAALP
jgi:hypothetical protein